VPCPSRFQSSIAQPKAWIIGARNSAGSEARPVITMSAPPASACAMRLGAEIGIGRQQPVAELLDGAGEFHDGEIAVLAGIEHVVADDGRDLQR